MALTADSGAKPAPVLQRRIRAETLAALGRLPGARPLDLADWLVADSAHAGQMALRDALIVERRGEVVALDEAARPAAEELLDLVLADLATRPGYAVGDVVRRPDGVEVRCDRDRSAASGVWCRKTSVCWKSGERSTC